MYKYKLHILTIYVNRIAKTKQYFGNMVQGNPQAQKGF